MPEQQLTEEQRKALQEKLKNMSPEELREFQKQQCVFCQIVAGKIPSKKIYEDQHNLAILDINPAARGHLLLLPKEHYAIMPQLSAEQLGSLFLAAKKLSQLLLKSLKVSGTNVFIANGLAAGQKSQHFMIHLIPRREQDRILNVEEKVLDTEARRKAIIAIENRLNQLVGIKKKVISLEEKQESVSEEEPKVEKKEKGKRAAPKKDVAPPEKEEGISLDDIASLFK